MFFNILVYLYGWFAGVESLSGDILQKSMKDFYTKPKLEFHSVR